MEPDGLVVVRAGGGRGSAARQPRQTELIRGPHGVVLATAVAAPMERIPWRRACSVVSGALVQHVLTDGFRMAEIARGSVEDESDRRVEFAAELRRLRERAGSPSFRKMAMRSGAISHTTLHEAAIGARFPSWATTREFVGVLGGDETEWRTRWEHARTEPDAPEPPHADSTSSAEPTPNPACEPDPVAQANPADRPNPAERPNPVAQPDTADRHNAVAQPDTDPVPAAEHPRSPADSTPPPSPASAPTVVAAVPEPRRKPLAIVVGALAVLLVAAIPIGFALVGNRHPATLPSATQPDPPTVAGPQNPAVAPRIPGDGSKFVADVTIPDGTTIRPGAHFTKVWEIANTGTVPWHGRFLRREGTPADNQGCGTPDQVPIADTEPGAHVLISVPVVAPAESGSCWVGWKMVDADGNYLFLGSRPVYFLVNVRP